MIYRRFGKTGLDMPTLSCGGMRFQHQWQDLPLDQVPRENQANLEAIVSRALELGIHHFETARGYGSSERQLGPVLAGLPRDRILVQTKVPPSRYSLRFLYNFKDSLKRLGLEYVDLLAIHGINNEERLRWTTGKCGCLRAARRLQERGLVRHVGFSTHGPLDVILRAIRHEEHGGFDYVNLHWYYVFQQNWPAIEAARARDMGVFIISPSDKGGLLYKPSEKLTELCRPLHPVVFNDIFCLSHPGVHTISVGAARPGDFDLHLKAIERLDGAEELLPPIKRRLEQALHDAVGEDFARGFQEGLPTWSETPRGINIPMILWLRNLALAWDMVEYARMRYRLLGKDDHWFPGNHAGPVEEVDLSGVLAGSPFADRIPDLLREAHGMLAEDRE